MIAVGDTVGNYRVAAKLGEGGMGQVFLAEHPVIGSKVAIKAVHSQYARNPEVVSRFVTEARAVNQVGHDHIVSITDFGTTPAGDFYFVMEYLQGAMLAEQIGAAFPPTRALTIAAQIADALQASHEQGVIHRDLKPANVLLITREGTPDFVKVFDFGLAKLIGHGAPAAHHTDAGIVMGTPVYMSPEQCVGDAEVDHRCDIYALGVILFEMLTGQVPFTGEGYGEVMFHHVNTPAPSVRSLVPGIPVALDALVARALVKDPGQRFQTMAELRAALLELASTLSEAATVTPRPRLLTPTSEALAGTGELLHVTDLRPRKRHHGLVLAGVAALAALVVANVGFRRASTRVVAGAPAAAASSPAPALVRVNFSSDPDGATISRPDGSVLGVTPLATDLPYDERPVEVRIDKPGYVSRVIAFVPNMPIPVVAVLAKKSTPADNRPVVSGDRPPAPARKIQARAARRSSISTTLNDDDVLPPTTW